MSDSNDSWWGLLLVGGLAYAAYEMFADDEQQMYPREIGTQRIRKQPRSNPRHPRRNPALTGVHVVPPNKAWGKLAKPIAVGHVGRFKYQLYSTGTPEIVQMHRSGTSDDDYESYTLFIKNGRIDPVNSVTDSGFEITSLSLPDYLIAEELYAALLSG